jgi:uncharacterized protein YndB with AHSA1/START domain
MTEIPEIVREVEICAPRETVFRYFCDSERFARWWGEGSKVDPRPGGEVRIRYPDGTVASGSFQEIVPPERVVFTYGYEGAGHPIPPGGSTVIVTLEETPGGTLVTLRHRGLPSVEVARHHEPGWRYQLSLFSKAVAAEQHSAAGVIADKWFAAWNETDPARRRELIQACATPDVTFHDDFAAVSGYEDLDGHIAASQVFMPAARVERVGEPARSHGNALVRWQVRDAQGSVTGKGVKSVAFGPDGRMTRVVGFWGA